jgi:hypothetical protein
VATDLYVDMAANEARKWQLNLQRLQAAGNAKGVAALEAIGGDPTRWDLAAWNTNMAWAFRTNLPTPNLDLRLLFPLALTSPIYTLRDLWTLFQEFQWSTAQMFQELKAYDARRLGSRLEVPFFLFQGEHDVITLTSLATEYFQEVQLVGGERLPFVIQPPPSQHRGRGRGRPGRSTVTDRNLRQAAQLGSSQPSWRQVPRAAGEPFANAADWTFAAVDQQWRGSNATRHRDPRGCGG